MWGSFSLFYVGTPSSQWATIWSFSWHFYSKLQCTFFLPINQRFKGTAIIV